MAITRRILLSSGAALGGAIAAGPAAAQSAAQSVAQAAGRSVVRAIPRRQGTTLASIFSRGAANVGGYQRLVRRGGERHLVRTDLGVKAKAKRKDRRRGLIAFVQLSDVHIVDAQSPLRVEWTDRFDDPGPTVTGVFTSAYRPWEMLSGQIADSMVRRINRIRTGPVTGRKLALAIQTGDNSDNSQFNEIRWNIDLLGGARVAVDSGDRGRYEGVCDSDPVYYDRAYWHPDGPPPGALADAAMTRFGYPKAPGLLDAARRPFRAQGLDMPWFTAFGNHDGLVQGNFPGVLPLNAIATGPVKIISPPAGANPAELLAGAGGDLPSLFASLALTPGARVVTPDPDRRLLSRAEIVEEHFDTPGLPRGHGFTATNRREGTAYYTVDRGQIRFIVLDSVNPNGNSNGSLDATQFAWLKKVLGRSQNKYCLIFSHHTSSSMDNPLIGTGADVEPRVLGEEVLALFLRNPKVVAWINGHTHRNEITAHRRDRPGAGGLWEINTAAHIDWPQQARIIEVVDNRDNTISIFSTVIDHAGPASNRGSLANPKVLAGLARELAANDPQSRTNPDRGRGRRRDRNVELLVRTPKQLRPGYRGKK
ncbi:TIGR03767 family metallophosphoesterase [Nocardioides salsibiostraticola]